MAHYRKIDVSIWNDDHFSSMKLQGKMAFLFLVTHPNMTGIGAMRATLPGMAAELGITQKEFSEVFVAGLANFAASENCVFVPNFLKYQSIDSPSPNVVKGWVKQSQFVPDGSLKLLALENVLSFLEGKGDSFLKAFDDSFLKVYGKSFAKPVSSKQLAVSSKTPPSTPAMTEDGGNSVGTQGEEVDPETGEVLKWAA